MQIMYGYVQYYCEGSFDCYYVLLFVCMKDKEVEEEEEEEEEYRFFIYVKSI